jgi:hypothetical protein
MTGDDRAFGFGLSIPNSTGWLSQFSSRTVEANFNPTVGFIDRVDIRDYALVFGYRKRFSDRWLRSAYAGVDSYRVEGLASGEVESQNVGFRFTFQNNTQDNIFTRLVANREVLVEDFTIYTPPDNPQNPIIVPAGDYKYTDYRIGFDSGNQRRISMRGSISGGDFYDGDRIQTNTELVWRPSEKFRFGFDYQVNDIKLPVGDFTVRISAIRAQYVFSSKLSWVNLIQYDNVSETVGLNSRLHWIPEAGREGFIVFNHNVADLDRDNAFKSTYADVAVKFSYTFRF